MFPASNTATALRPESQAGAVTMCFHCGAPCISDKIHIGANVFCCQGCKLVYELLEEKGLCDYYAIRSHPGISQIKPLRNDKFSYLDDEKIAEKLCQFRSANYCIVTLYVPSIHCSSCLWLLEHLGRIDSAIIESRVNFSAKEITVRFYPGKTSLRKIVELLATIGYEPYISLDDVSEKKINSFNRQRIVKLGIAGFCFGNIMMMSFPEYLAGGSIDASLALLFRYLDLLLSLPVFFYSATEFYSAAWKGLKQKTLNIDAPIVVALFITFGRSVYEILSGTGSGYLDSMAGIVFFMLVGRVLQERTYRSLTFTRDYKAYFPIAVSVKSENGIIKKQLKDLRRDDVVMLNHGEIIPSDSYVVSGDTTIDYSFVTGESEPVPVKEGDLVYAGGRLLGQTSVLKIFKPIMASYLTSLWDHGAFRKNKAESNNKASVIHVMSRYFTVVLFSLALLTAAWWSFHDPSRIVTSVSAMLIVACPCALLLAATFTNSNVLRIFSINGLYLRDATVIEQMSKLDTIVFDKTGTITMEPTAQAGRLEDDLNEHEKDMLYAVVSQSNHPNSIALKKWLCYRAPVQLDSWEEVTGEGIKATAANDTLLVGNAHFVGAAGSEATEEKAAVYVNINGRIMGFRLASCARPGIADVIRKLSGRYSLSVLSGDHDRQRPMLNRLFGPNHSFRFEQKPIDKLRYIEELQKQGKRAAMIGDGLNDAGALQQSNVGIALADDINNFSPASDAIMEARKVSLLPSLLTLSRQASVIINLSFLVSVVYNVIGLYFAMRGSMRPVVAAILMPCSTLSIVVISSGLSDLLAWKKGLAVRSA